MSDREQVLSAGFDYMERARVSHEANVAKLHELAKLAQEKADEANDRTAVNREYWLGVRDGLRRAITVLEGRG